MQQNREKTNSVSSPQKSLGKLEKLSFSLALQRVQTPVPPALDPMSALTQTECPALHLLARGKVRDIYSVPGCDDALLFVATDRVSAFDVIMKNVRLARTVPGSQSPPPRANSLTLSGRLAGDSEQGQTAHGAVALLL